MNVKCICYLSLTKTLSNSSLKLLTPILAHGEKGIGKISSCSLTKVFYRLNSVFEVSKSHFISIDSNFSRLKYQHNRTDRCVNLLYLWGLASLSSLPRRPKSYL